MKNRLFRRFESKPVVLAATVAVLILFVSLLCPAIWSHVDISSPMGTVRYTDGSWKMKIPSGGMEIPVIPGEYLKLKKGNVYRMHDTVSYDGTKDKTPSMFLQLSHSFVRVLMDDELLFSYMPEDENKWDRSKSPGYIYKVIPLPKNYIGREMTVEFIPSLDIPMEYEVPNVFFGDYGSVLRGLLYKDMPHNIVTILCGVLGVATLVFSAASFTGSDYREGFNIGTFALLVALYFMANCEINYYYIGNPYYLYFINLLTLSLMPVAFMGVMREFMGGRRKRLCTAVVAFEMFLFMIELILHMTGVVDMREVLSLIHILGFSEVILVAGLFFSLKDKEERRSLLMQLLPIALGTVADCIIYWQHLAIGLNATTFTTIGLVIFLFKLLITKVIKHARQLSEMQRHTIEGMASLIESRDGSTGEHVRNTGVYARMLAEKMYEQGMYPEEINRDFIEHIGWMAPLHDVGKIKVPDAVLNKKGKFTPEEYEIMKTHAALGGEIIRQIMSKDTDPEMMQMAVNIATYHHERWDGTGYPEGLKGTEIPLCARIMAVADVFDALSSRRVYKPEMSIDRVFQELKANENTQFQKEIVQIACSIRPQMEAYVQKNKAERLAKKKEELMQAKLREQQPVRQKMNRDSGFFSENRLKDKMEFHLFSRRAVKKWGA